jgi:hypothetical protein
MARFAAALASLILFCGALHALAVGPRIYEQKDLGDIALSEFTYSISADCNASTISAYILNESNKPVPDANVYLKYVDFSTPLISSTKTDKDGFTLIRLPGNTRLMRGLFIMVIERKGYRNKELHFDLSPCFGSSGNVPMPPKNNSGTKPNATANGTGQALPKPPANGTSQNASGEANGTAAGNMSAGNETRNQSGSGQSGGGDGTGATPGPCPAAAFVAAAAAAAVFYRSR